MKISMIGIDHSKASVDLREKFALTKSKVALGAKKIKENFPVDGVLILSTCNRTEIWLSDYKGESLYEIIQAVYGVDKDLFKEYFSLRSGEGAVNHLFELSCGLKSKIIGEDQILAQVKESIVIARESETMDIVLEKLFQMAVTSAKKVKTSIRLTPVNTSVATKALELLERKFKILSGVKCLIIGNGEIGRLTARTLSKAGLNVTMTLRQYKKAAVIIPENCTTIQYDDRVNYLNKSQVIISATLSPHNTLVYEDVVKVLDGKQRIFIDLAMPRDIDSRVGDIKGCELFDIDTLSESSENELLNKQIEFAKLILRRYLNEFSDFYYYKNLKWLNIIRESKVEVRR